MDRIEADVAIVGGGLIGCMAAYYLSKRGRSVVVLDRGLVGGESSGVSFGSLRLQGQHGIELPLALRSHALWEGIEAELGDSLEFVQKGHVHLALNADHVARLEQNAAEMRPFGLSVELVDGAEARRRWPFLGAGIVAASWSPRDAVVNPRFVAPAFARAARRLGVRILEGWQVVEANSGGGRFQLRVQSGGKGETTVVSDALVNAAGAWCDWIAGCFGESIPVFAAGPAELVTDPIERFVEPVIHVVDGSILFRQTARGNVVVGGHPRGPVDPVARRARVPPEKIQTNLGRLVAVAPRLASHHLIRSWTGIEGYVADMMPVLGPSATTPGLFHACAFSGHGLQLGPAAGMILSELIVDGATKSPIAAFDIRRFSDRAETRSRATAEEFQRDVPAPDPGGAQRRAG